MAAPPRVPMRSILGYMAATFVFAGILGAMVGFVGGIIITQKVLEGRMNAVAASGPPIATFVIPDGANLELDGEKLSGGPTLQRELTAGQRYELRVTLKDQPTITFPLTMTAGEHRTVLIPGAVTE
jgi:hypothetical protein